ncbi:MAG: site-specific tyrosine recombinase XerD, partial [Rubrivivax sp.]
MTDPEALAAASEGLAGAFVDSLWLEEGLSRNTLDAYRRDLVLLGQWLAEQGKQLPETTEADLNA